MITPFMTPQTDGKTRYFWDISVKGNISNAIASKPRNDFNFKYQAVPRGGRYQSIFVYCNEEELYYFEEYLNSLGQQYFKIVGTDFLKEEVLRHFIKLSVFDDFWTNEIDELNFKR